MSRLAAVASLLLATPVSAHTAAPSFALENRPVVTAWASGQAEAPVAGTIVGENCYYELDVVTGPDGRTDQTLELLCD